MGRLSDHAQLIALGLLNYADDEGYFLADPALVRSAIKPFQSDDGSVTVSLQALSEAGWIVTLPSSLHGPIGKIVNFTRHQFINKPKPSKLKAYVLPSEDGSDTVSVQDECLLEQGTGNREQGMDVGAAVAAPAIDSEWIESLKRDQTYAGIDVGVELGKMRRWCETHGKQPSRRRFVNWLNRAERPMNTPQVRREDDIVRQARREGLI